jgi:hypothetical protein
MIRSEVQYGCVGIGEATIFLKVPNDPKTIYYFLSVPKGDVGETSGWVSGSEGDDQLHLTAVGQMLAFTLRALRTQHHDSTWRNKNILKLQTLEVVYEDILNEIPKDNKHSAKYRQPQQIEYLHMSSVQP